MPHHNESQSEAKGVILMWQGLPLLVTTIFFYSCPYHSAQLHPVGPSIHFTRNKKHCLRLSKCPTKLGYANKNSI